MEEVKVLANSLLKKVYTRKSVSGGGDLMRGNIFIELVNDTQSPGNNKVYGTNSQGEKGWVDQQSAGQASVTSDILVKPNYNSEYQSVLTAAALESVQTPNESQNDAINDLIRELKENDFLSITEALNVYGFGSIQFGTFNLVNPNTLRHTSPDISSVQFGSMGIKSAGSGNSYMNTNYAVNKRAGIEGAFTTIIYVSENSNEGLNERVYGSRCGISGSASQKTLIPYISGGSFGSRFSYENSGSSFINSNHKGLYIITRNGASEIVYKDYDGINGVKHSRSVTPIVPTLSNNELFLAYNSHTGGGVDPQSHYTKWTSCICRLNTNISDDDAIKWKSIWDTFRTTVGI